MNPEHKKYILENVRKKPFAQIAAELGIREKNVKKIIRIEMGKKAPASAGSVMGPKISTHPVPVKKAIILASIALIIILGFAVYANSLNGKFVYDDQNLIENSALIKEWPVSLKVFTADFGTFDKSPFYRPLQRITYAIDYHAWKLNVVGYHLTGILLHILVALCVYWFINILFNDKTLSALTAVFFAVHPIHTGVVNYISSRADSLYLFFMLSSFIFYIKFSKANSVIRYIIMISSYSLALLSKENSLILPVLILLYHYTFKEKIQFRAFLSISGIAFIYVLLRMTVLKYLITGAVSNSTLLQRIPGFFAAVATYIRLMFLPFGLHMDYGTPLFNFIDPKAICGFGILGALIFCAFKTIKTNRLIFFSLSWFLITLLPVSNLYPINAYMAENWLYLPSIGVFLILAGSLRAFYKKEKSRILAMILTACLLAFYSYLTIRQNETWREPILFYERILKYVPDSSRIYNNLGLTYHGMGKKEEAMAMYKKAIEIKPDYADAYNNLARIYHETGREEEAIAMYKKAIEINPDYANAYNNLGLTYHGMGKKEEAMAMYRKAIEINPDHDTAYNNLARIYDETGRKEEAIAIWKKAIEINPYYAGSYNNLGLAYYKMGKKEEAIAMWKKAIEIKPDCADSYNNLGSAYFEMDREEDAAAAFKRTLEINPAHADARHNLEIINSKLK